VSEGRDPRGRFTSANRAARGRKPAGGGIAFARWAREAFEDPDRRRKLLARVDRELATLGPAPLTVKLLSYAFESKVTIRHEIRARAQRLAAELGIPEEELLREAERLTSLSEEEVQ